MLRDQGVVYEFKGKSSIPMAALHAAETWTLLQKGKKVSLSDARQMYDMMNVKTAAGAYNVRVGFKALKTFGADGDVMVSMNDLISDGGLMVDPKKLWHEALDRLPTEDMAYMLSARQKGEKMRASPRVRLSTIHSAKGAEADHVVLMTEMAWRTAREAYRNPDDERRVWYVGVTRARQKLTIVSSETQNECQWI
jgi:superfamily I DNA/RNA helicase